MDKEKFELRYKDEIEVVTNWSDELVNKCMGETLNKIFNIHDRLQGSEITMAELEWILTDLPIELIYISERLSRLQLSLETVKLTKAHDELEDTRKLKSDRSMKYTATEIKQIVADKHADDNIGIKVYELTIEQVEKYISLSKELIMGAKKIWTRRVDTEEVNPIVPPKDLPDYDIGGNENK